MTATHRIGWPVSIFWVLKGITSVHKLGPDGHGERDTKHHLDLFELTILFAGFSDLTLCGNLLHGVCGTTHNPYPTTIRPYCQ